VQILSPMRVTPTSPRLLMYPGGRWMTYRHGTATFSQYVHFPNSFRVDLIVHSANGIATHTISCGVHRPSPSQRTVPFVTTC
jgi:hypothetical protein